MSQPPTEPVLSASLRAQLEESRAAARVLRAATSAQKNAVLLAAAEGLRRESASILAANATDLAAFDAAPPFSGQAAFRDRLLLDDKRLGQMRESLQAVAALPDPVGEITESRTLASGVRVRRVRSPLGVILMIFESRPNVATEAFSLAFKAGNALILRGGKESMATTARLYEVLHGALRESGLPAEALFGITDPDRAITQALLRQRAYIDVVVPRGGDGLIDYVVRNSLIPVIKNDRGLCHVYVHEDADLDAALAIVENAKTQRPGVCNAMETLLVHSAIAERFLPLVYARLSGEAAPRPVRFHACERSLRILAAAPFSSPAVAARLEPVTSESYDTEYLDLELSCRIVDDLDEAIAHIERHGSRHSEAILTRSEPAARRFQAEIDAAAVYWNASTRFTDGFELGLGGELGISTQKLHVRGPVGLRELTSVRWLLDGDGQVRP